MATAAPVFKTGARRTYNPIFGGGDNTMAGGTPALGDSAVLAELIANLQNFYAAQPGTGGPQNAGPSIIDVLNQSLGNNLSQQGPAAEMSTPAPGTPTISPETLATLGSIFGAGGTVMGNEAASGIGGMMSTAGNMAQQNPLDALQGMASVGANLAGANPGVVGAVNTGINTLQGQIPTTPHGIAGKGLDIVLGFTPIGIINTIMQLATGKSLGDVLASQMMPVEGISIPNAIAQQASNVAAGKGTDPMDELMALTGAFGTNSALQPAMSMGTPATPTTSPTEAMTDLAVSMIGMPAPSAPTPTNPEAPMGIPGEPGFGTNNDSIAIADAIAEAMSAMAESSMNAPSDVGIGADATGDSGSVGDVGGIGDVSEGSGGASPW